MIITREPHEISQSRWMDWHILTVAEAGFSMLDIYGRHHHGLDIEVIHQFANLVNQTDALGSLLPRAPISAIPNRHFRESARSMSSNSLDDFNRHLSDFVIANRSSIEASQILIDFHVSPNPVPIQYINATEELFRSAEMSSILKIVIFE